MPNQPPLFHIPDQFATDLVSRAGNAGQTWLQNLPHLVEQLCREWDLTLDGPVRHGFTGLGLPVIRHGEKEEALFLKLYWRDRDTKHAPAALKIWNGRGAVKLVDHDADAGALLLEKLDPQKTLQQVEIGRAVPIAGQLLRRLAIPAPNTLPTVAAAAEVLQNSLPRRWNQLGRPFSRSLLDQLCVWTQGLASQSTSLLTDYDLHYLDILAAEREPWLMIDPKPIAGDLEFALAQLLWTRCDEMESAKGVRHYFELLVEAADLDPQRARMWTMIRCADYWLWGLSVGFTEDPLRCAIIIRSLGLSS